MKGVALLMKNKKLNLFDATKITLSLTAIFSPIFLNSNNVNASPGRVLRPAFTITTGSKQMMRKLTQTSSGSGYVSLVSGKSSLGSPLTPVSPLQARNNMLRDIAEDMGRSTGTPQNPSLVLSALKNQQSIEEKVKVLSKTTKGFIDPKSSSSLDSLNLALRVEQEYNRENRVKPSLGDPRTRALVKMLADVAETRRRELNHSSGLD